MAKEALLLSSIILLVKAASKGTLKSVPRGSVHFSYIGNLFRQISQYKKDITTMPFWYFSSKKMTKSVRLSFS